MTVDIWGTQMDHNSQCGTYSSNVSKPQQHFTSPLPACYKEQNHTNPIYCSSACKVAELNNPGLAVYPTPGLNHGLN